MNLIITILASILIYLLIKNRKPKIVVPEIADAAMDQMLLSKVEYYTRLVPEEKTRFRLAIQNFLSKVAITGIKTDVTDEDRLLVSASAIIPIFAFPGWEYPNLNEVLLYPENFDSSFDLSGPEGERQVLGMVGDGAMHRVMILSKPSLLEGFSNKTDKSNTAIHEFVHLIDKTDGSVDGVPALLLDKAYVKPWLQLIHQNIAQIQADKSDINPYGATNEAEFFAVAAEYFFERPLLFAEKHPELYALMEKAFRQNPRTDTQH